MAIDSTITKEDMQTPQRPYASLQHGTRFPRSRTAAAVLAAGLGALVVLLAVANLFPASSNIFTLAGTYVWASAAPHLVIVSLVAVLLTIPLWRVKRGPVLRAVATGAAALALAASTGITGSLVIAATSHGGSVDLVQAVTLSTPIEPATEITSYVTVGGEPMEARVYEPEGGAEGAPVMMYIHGGGWQMGSAEESESTAQHWAAQGWYVVSVNYRLSSAEQATWDQAPADVACALTWTDHHAAEAGADSDRLTVMGDSAGGHLAVLLGWSAADGAAASTCADQGEVPVPDAIVASYPAIDVQYNYDYGVAPVPGIDPQDFTHLFLGGTPAEFPDRQRAISPLTYLSDATPSTLVMQPDRDDFIPAEGNYRSIETAAQAGVDATIVAVPFAWHAFDAPQGGLGGQLKNSVTKNWLEDRDLAPQR